MKKITTGFAIVAALLCTSCIRENFSDSGKMAETSKLVGNPFGEKEDGNLLIRLTAEAAKDMAEGIFAYDEVFDGLGEVCVEPLFPGSSENDGHNLHKWYALSFDSSVSVETAAEIVSGNEEIEAVQYNSILKSTHNNESFEYQAVPSTRSSASDLPFDDLLLKDQWDLINDGTVVEDAVAGADVGVKDAWRLTAGDPRVVVAILDQGVAINHPDLKDALWINEAEVNGTDGKDDDGNGYIDDKNGYNFAYDKGRPSVGPKSDHGTHIAGTIAATNNNGYGVSSIAGGSGKGDGVRVMTCQTFKEDGQSTSGWIAKAFYYAAKNGACIAQCSYGYSEMEGMSSYEISEWMRESAEYEALQFFLNPENANCEALESNIAVYSAGNFNKPASLYPGAFRECISVTAFGPDFLPGGYSNYGAGCDISAPGGDIVENVPDAPCMILSTSVKDMGQPSFTYKYGTSMACPHVSGVVALGASYALKIGKKFGREDFTSRLLASANDMDGYLTESTNKLWVNTYFDNTKESYVTEYKSTDVFVKKGKMGTGAVDAWKFLMALEGTPTYLTVPGKSLVVETGPGAYTLEIDQESKESLGITGTPAISDGKIVLTCSKVGAGKIRLKGSVGKDESGVIPELDFYKEISIVSRPSVAQNGGWL